MSRPKAGFAVVLLVVAVASCSDHGPTREEQADTTQQSELSKPRKPAYLVITAGAAVQLAVVGTSVPVDPRIRVTDSVGVPVPDVWVSFAVTDGDGTVTQNREFTDWSGTVTAHWTLGPRVKTNALQVKATGLPSVSFTAQSVPKIVVAAGETPQNSAVLSPVPVPPAVVAKDGLGDPVAGASVTFSGDGTVVPAVMTTDSNGRAQASSWTLSTRAGLNIMYAWTSKVGQGSAVEFDAFASPGPAARWEFLTLSSELALQLGDESASVYPWVSDAYGNHLSSDSALSFSSTNPSVATVSGDGRVAPIQPGFATVSVTRDTLLRSFPVMVYRKLDVYSQLDLPTEFTFLKNRGLALLDDNTALGLFTDLRGARKFDLHSGVLREATLFPGNHGPVDLAVDPSRDLAYMPTAAVGGLAIVQLSTMALLDTVPFPPSNATGQPLNGIRVIMSPNRGFVYLSQGGGDVSIVDVSTRKRGWTIKLDDDPDGLAIAPDGATLYASTLRGTVYRIDAATGQILNSSRMGGRARDVALSADGSQLYVANDGDDLVAELDPVTLEKKRQANVVDPAGLALSPDGQLLYAVGGRISILSRATMTVLGSYGLRQQQARTVVFASDGTPIAAVSGAIMTLGKGAP